MDSSIPYPDINLLLEELLRSAQAILGEHFVGLYLDGSLAGGDFDQDSDIDFVVVTDQPVSDEQFTALQAMHDRLAELDSPWAIQLEGFYISQPALRRYDPEAGLVPNIERGRGERLKWVPLDRSWEVHRSLLRARGLILAGPAPETLIDPVSPAQLRQAMLFIFTEWAAQIILEPDQIKRRGYQSYTILSLCRILYTLQHGEVVSKRAAAHWAQQAFGERWAQVIESAWEGRRNPDQPTSPEEMQETLGFIRYSFYLANKENR
jgi:predicted nucleotidyltransferase